MFDFPNSPTPGQIFTPPGGPTYTYTNGAWAASFVPPGPITGVPEAPMDSNVYGRINATWQLLPGGGGDFTPPGTVIWFAGPTPPTGYIKANGASLLRASYPNLFTAIGTTWGAVDGTHFNVPDLRGEFPRGLDDTRGVDTGRVLGTAQAELIKGHTHTATVSTAPTHTHGGVTGTESADHTHYFSGTLSIAAVGNHTHSYTDEGSADTTTPGGAFGAKASSATKTTGAAGSHTHTGSVAGYTGGRSAAHTHTISPDGSHTHTVDVNASANAETRPRNVALLACIKI